MKNYEEVTENVFRKSEEIIKQNRRRRNTIMKIGVSAGCLAIIGTVGAGAWNRGHNASPIEAVQSTESTVKQSESGSTLSVVSNSSTGGKSSIAEKIPESNSAFNGPIMGPDSDNSIPMTFITRIDGFEVEDNERKIAPANGQIHISKAVSEAMRHYGDVDENNNEIIYRVVIEYLQDQQIIPATRELYDRESARLKEQRGRGLNFETYSWDWGAHSRNTIWAYFTKSEIENFTADENYGYVIELYDNYFGYPISNNDELVIH